MPDSPTVVEIAGQRFFIRRGREQGDINVIREVWEEDTYGLRGLAQSHDFAGARILDVGAHIGAFGVLCQHLWPGCWITAIEPNSVSYGLLCDNLKASYKVRPILGAVSYDPSRTMLTDAVDGTGCGFLITPAKECEYPRRTKEGSEYVVAQHGVTARPLEEMAIDPPYRLVKLDCEGAELDILRHASQEFLDQWGVVVGEYHDPDGPEAFAALLKSRFPRHEITVEAPHAAGIIGNFMALPR